MKNWGFQTVVMVVAVLLLLTLPGCGSKEFELKSAAFKNDERIPDKYYSGDEAERQGLSLPFNWVNPPAGTKSFALVVHHASRYVNWAILNIPANCTSIAENASGKNMPAGSIELLNFYRTSGYCGLESIGKGSPHGYNAVLFALNEVISFDDTGVYKTFSDIKMLLNGKIIAQTEINGIASIVE
jgi:phosphatidylethanolamine-binding protein (PEBP) family uncharacterized protein